jgi:quinol monooxygenase YgiN
LLREVWRDRATLVAHFATEHMGRFRKELRALRIERRSAIGYETYSEFDPLVLSET